MATRYGAYKRRQSRLLEILQLSQKNGMPGPALLDTMPVRFANLPPTTTLVSSQTHLLHPVPSLIVPRSLLLRFILIEGCRRSADGG